MIEVDNDIIFWLFSARKQLLRMQNELDMMSDTLMSSLKIARNLCPDSQRGRIAEAIKTVRSPESSIS